MELLEILQADFIVAPRMAQNRIRWRSRFVVEGLEA